MDSHPGITQRATLHRISCAQDRFVAIYLEMHGVRSVDRFDERYDRSTMRLTFVKCRRRGANITPEDCVKVRSLRNTQ